MTIFRISSIERWELAPSDSVDDGLMSRHAPLVFECGVGRRSWGSSLASFSWWSALPLATPPGPGPPSSLTTEQGLCGNPVVCADLEARYQYWSTVFSLSVIGLLGGLVLFIWAVIRGISGIAARTIPRSPEPVCVACGWPLVWVLPPGRWYCRTCAQYRKAKSAPPSSVRPV